MVVILRWGNPATVRRPRLFAWHQWTRLLGILRNFIEFSCVFHAFKIRRAKRPWIVIEVVGGVGTWIRLWLLRIAVLAAEKAFPLSTPTASRSSTIPPNLKCKIAILAASPFRDNRSAHLLVISLNFKQNRPPRASLSIGCRKLPDAPCSTSIVLVLVLVLVL